MKFVFSILLISTAAFFVTGCEKSKAEKAVFDSIIGTWELSRTSGMITTNYPAGSGNILKITPTSYERYKNGQLVENGTYEIVQDNSVEENTCLQITDGQFENRITFSGTENPHKVFMQLSNNTLQLVSGCFAYDGGAFTDYTLLESPTEMEN